MPVAAREGRLLLRNGKKDRLTWSWTTGVSSKGDFGNPLATTAYDLCLYDKGTGALRLLSRTSLPAGGTCSGGACWQERPDGFAYRDPASALQSLVLRGASPGHASIVAQSVGGALSLPTMPLAPPVLVRLRARDGLCWGVNFSLPKKNSARRFQSKGDFAYSAE
jgi:hypothetical protein